MILHTPMDKIRSGPYSYGVLIGKCVRRNVSEVLGSWGIWGFFLSLADLDSDIGTATGHSHRTNCAGAAKSRPLLWSVPLLECFNMEAAVKKFFSSSCFAVAGASQDTQKYGYKGI